MTNERERELASAMLGVEDEELVRISELLRVHFRIGVEWRASVTDAAHTYVIVNRAEAGSMTRPWVYLGMRYGAYPWSQWYMSSSARMKDIVRAFPPRTFLRLPVGVYGDDVGRALKAEGELLKRTNAYRDIRFYNVITEGPAARGKTGAVLVPEPDHEALEKQRTINRAHAALRAHRARRNRAPRHGDAGAPWRAEDRRLELALLRLVRRDRIENLRVIIEVQGFRVSRW